MECRSRLLLIGHSYAALENRKKVQALAAHFDLVCVTSTIENKTILGQPASNFDGENDAYDRRYKLVRCPRHGFSDTTFLYQGLAKVMRSQRFDVVLVENEPWAIVCWQARLLKGIYQKQALFGEFTWENLERPSVKGAVLSRIYQAMSATTDFIIAGNQTAAKIVAKHGVRRADVLVAAQLGVDLYNHQPATPSERMLLRERQSLPTKSFIVGYCGRLTEEKGIIEFLTACDALAPKGLHAAILGAGRLKPWLEKQRATRPWLHLLPPRPHFEIPDFLRCLDVFVLASKPLHDNGICWEEQFGHVLIEAMACGVTTLGSSSGAIPEVIGQKEAIFAWGDAEALKERLQYFHNNAIARADLASRQYERTAHYYTHEAVAAHWANFIQQKLALS